MAGKSEYKKGLWTVEEDKILTDYIRVHGKGKWNRIAKVTELKRCGKSCRLRWINYLSPHVKRGDFTEEEEDLIIRLHNLLGNRWSLIAGRVPGRTDNQVKNHWNSHLCRRVGVRKSKTKAAATSSQTLSKESVQILSTSSESNFVAPIPNCNNAVAAGELEVIECGTDQIAAAEGFNSKQELIKVIDDDHNYDNSSWFSNIDDMDLKFPNNFMEFLDKSHDFVWDGL